MREEKVHELDLFIFLARLTAALVKKGTAKKQKRETESATHCFTTHPRITFVWCAVLVQIVTRILATPRYFAHLWQKHTLRQKPLIVRRASCLKISLMYEYHFYFSITIIPKTKLGDKSPVWKYRFIHFSIFQNSPKKSKQLQILLNCSIATLNTKRESRCSLIIHISTR